jgi:hypothetical protein
MIGVLWGLYFFSLRYVHKRGYQVVGRLVGTHRERGSVVIEMEGGGWLQVLTRHDMVVVWVWVCVCVCVYQRFWRAQQVSVLECRLKEVLAHVWLKGAKCCWSVG